MELIEVNNSEASEKRDSGILLLAVGNSLYGKLALNLALGLKKAQPEIKIALIYNESAVYELDEAQKFFFDYKILCPHEYSQDGINTCYVKPKLYLDKLTPFAKTLFLDADIVWSPYKKPLSVFDDYKNIQFTMANRGMSDINSGHSDWVNLPLMKQNFGIEKWIDLSSEWIYFTNSDECTQLFESAREFYADERLVCKQFAGGKPDEPVFCLAMLKLNMKPHVIPYYPTYWEPVHRHKGEQDMYMNYYGISLGGKHISDRVRKIANNLTRHYTYHSGVTSFELEDKFSKSKYLKERTLI